MNGWDARLPPPTSVAREIVRRKSMRRLPVLIIGARFARKPELAGLLPCLALRRRDDFRHRVEPRNQRHREPLQQAMRPPVRGPGRPSAQSPVLGIDICGHRIVQPDGFLHSRSASRSARRGCHIPAAHRQSGCARSRCCEEGATPIRVLLSPPCLLLLLLFGVTSLTPLNFLVPFLRPRMPGDLFARDFLQSSAVVALRISGMPRHPCAIRSHAARSASDVSRSARFSARRACLMWLSFLLMDNSLRDGIATVIVTHYVSIIYLSRRR